LASLTPAIGAVMLTMAVGTASLVHAGTGDPTHADRLHVLSDIVHIVIPGAIAPHRVINKRIGRLTMHINKAEIVAILRSRGLYDRADWVERDLPGLVDTHMHGSLLRLLDIDPSAMQCADVH